MALSPSTISASILSAGSEFTGLTFPSLCNAIGNAVFSWVSIPSNYSLSGVTTGVMGAGVVSGKIILVPNIGLIQTAFSGQNILGITAPFLAKAVAIGLSTSFSAYGQYVGPSVGVSLGSDSSSVSISNPSTLLPLMISSMLGSFGGVGPSASNVAAGLSTGIALLLQTAQGVGTVAGTPTSPASSVGSSPISKVF